jgi:hypothetical protein
VFGVSATYPEQVDIGGGEAEDRSNAEDGITSP